MGLFRSKEEKAAAKWYKQQSIFLEACRKADELIDEFLIGLGTPQDKLDNDNTFVGMLMFRDSLIFVSTLTIKDPAAKARALELIDILAVSVSSSEAFTATKTSLNDFKSSVIEGSKIYVKALNDESGLSIPALSTFRSIPQLEHIQLPSDAGMNTLPELSSSLIKIFGDLWSNDF